MYNDIQKAVVECGHCILENNVIHQKQQILGKLDYDEPFDIICLDIYVPG
jgi:Ni,Fe-hydrogenase III small subunit